jgi:hypothetical protein
MNKLNPSFRPLILLVALFMATITAACSGNQPQPEFQTPAVTAPAIPQSVAVSEAEAPTQPSAEAAYPGAPATVTRDSGYPSPSRSEDLLATPPDPARIFPEVPADRGVVGGVLVQQVTEDGYLPVTPLALALGDYLENSRGEPALIRYNDSSPHAQIFNTGVFMFSDVEPGIYALVINLGFAQFVIQNDRGYDLVVEVKAGEAVDLGQVFVNLPQD